MSRFVNWIANQKSENAKMSRFLGSLVLLVIVAIAIPVWAFGQSGSHPVGLEIVFLEALIVVFMVDSFFAYGNYQDKKTDAEGHLKSLIFAQEDFQALLVRQKGGVKYRVKQNLRRPDLVLRKADGAPFEEPFHNYHYPGAQSEQFVLEMDGVIIERLTVTPKPGESITLSILDEQISVHHEALSLDLQALGLTLAPKKEKQPEA